MRAIQRAVSPLMWCCPAGMPKPLGVVLRLHADLVRQVHVEPADGIHDRLEGPHVEGEIVIGLHAEVEVQRARQQTRSLAGTVIVAETLVAVEICLVEFALRDVIVIRDVGDLHPQVARHLEDGDARVDEVHAHQTDDVRQAVKIMLPARIRADGEDVHHSRSAAERLRRGGLGCSWWESPVAVSSIDIASPCVGRLVRVGSVCVEVGSSSAGPSGWRYSLNRQAPAARRLNRIMPDTSFFFNVMVVSLLFKRAGAE